MRTIPLLFFAAVLSLGLCTGSMAAFAKDAEALPGTAVVNFKAPQLKDWQNANVNERYAFLIGVATMFDAERQWQSINPLPVNQSSIGMWNKGFVGVTFQDMHDAIDAYIAANPDRMDEQVLETLGRIYIGPKLTEKERKLAGAHFAKIQKAAER